MKAKLNGLDVLIITVSRSGRECLVQHKSGNTEWVDTFALEY